MINTNLSRKSNNGKATHDQIDSEVYDDIGTYLPDVDDYLEYP